MATEIDQLVVSIETESDGSSKSLDRMAQALEKLSGTTSKLGGLTRQLRRLREEIAAFDSKQLNSLTRLFRSLQKLSTAEVRLPSVAGAAKDLKNLSGPEMDQVAKKLERLKQTATRATQKDRDPDGPGPEVSRKLEGLQNPLQDATPDIQGDTVWDVITEKLERLKQTATRATQSLCGTKEAAEHVAPEQETAGAITSREESPGAADAARQAQAAVPWLERLREAAKKARSALGGIWSRGRAVSSGLSAPFTAFLHPLRTAGSLLGRFRSVLRGTGSDAQTASQSFSLFGNGILRSVSRILMYRVIRSMLSGITNGISTGITNLYHANGTFAASMDRCATAAQYLKNSLAAALSPAINALAPVLDYIVGRVVDFINVINQLISVMTGASSWTKAVKVPAQWGSAADGAADSAGKANDAAKELQRTLMGFDEINKLNADPSSGSGSGGVGGSGGGTDYASMFTTEQVPLDGIAGKLSDIWQVFRDAWDSTGSAVMDSAKNALSTLKTLATDLGIAFANVWTGGTGQAFLESILDRVRSLLDLISSLAGTFDQAWTHAGHGEAMIEAILGRMTEVNALIVTMRDSFIVMWNNGTGVAVWSNLLQIITSVNNTVGNLARQFRTAWEDNGTGQRVWQALADAVNGVLDAIRKAAQATEAWAGELNLTPLLKSVAALSEAVAPLVSAVADVAETLYEKALLPIAKLAAESGLPLLIQGIATVIGLVSKLAQGLAAVVDWLGQIKWNGLEGLTNGEGLFTLPDTDELKLKITGILSGVEDRTTEKDRTLRGVTGVLSEMEDEIPGRDKIVGKVTARATGMQDRIASGYKLVGGVTARFTKASDKLSDSQKTLLTEADFTSRSDSLTTLDKTFPAKAKFTSRLDRLTGPLKTFSTRANFSSRTDSLTALQKTFSTRSNFTSRSDSLTSLQKTFTTRANFTSRNDSLSSSQKTFSVTARATSLNTDRLKTNGRIYIPVHLKATGSLGGSVHPERLATGGIFHGGRWQPIQGYATGGSPSSARLFYANENGMPELVGRIGSSTAVMNNGQIVASVAGGVYQATSLSLGRLGVYFQRISTSLGQIPVALDAAADYIAAQAAPEIDQSREPSLDGASLTEKLVSALTASGEDRPITVENHIYLDGRQIYQGTYEDIRKYSSSHNGRLPFPV